MLLRRQATLSDDRNQIWIHFQSCPFTRLRRMIYRLKQLFQCVVLNVLHICPPIGWWSWVSILDRAHGYRRQTPAPQTTDLVCDTTGTVVLCWYQHACRVQNDTPKVFCCDNLLPPLPPSKNLNLNLLFVFINIWRSESISSWDGFLCAVGKFCYEAAINWFKEI